MAAQTREQWQTFGSPDSRLADALGPVVETTLNRSVRNHPTAWAEAIYPILAPAIRMAISAALHDMVQMLNQLLENSLSVRSWRWRLEAWRTSKPFAEVVLLRTLVYAVERVLLVDKNSGLLISSVSAPGATRTDDDLVSGMLVAIQEFIQDSFHLEHHGIREIHLGDFSLWVEAGSNAALAALVRGNGPVELREVLRAAVDLIHQELGDEIRDFNGNSKPIESRCRPILEGCLQSRLQIERPTSYWRVWLCAAILGVALAGWAGVSIWQARRWDKAVEALRDTPGMCAENKYWRDSETPSQHLRKACSRRMALRRATSR
jgi:OOP family OmpA-OmpF porin